MKRDINIEISKENIERIKRRMNKIKPIKVVFKSVGVDKKAVERVYNRIFEKAAKKILIEKQKIKKYH